MAASTGIPHFTVTRRSPERIVPAKPTPFEVLKLSDLDHEPCFSTILPCIHFYDYNPSMENVDPVKLLKEALARALVFYYPLAGRLKESPEDKRKMVVECTDEGVVFFEADADVTIKELGFPLRPPFPFLNEFTNGDSGVGSPYFTYDIFNSPLVQIQVTRMKCGGFVFGTRTNHIMLDGVGCVQFLKALSEIARGATSPSIPPVWQRELLCARNPPRLTCETNEFIDPPKPIPATSNMAYRLIFFTKTVISSLRNLAPHHLQSSSSFDLITTCLWRTHALAFRLNPEEPVPTSFAVNARQKFNPPLPEGYYGNAIGFAGVMSTAGELKRNPFGYALEKVVKAKKSVTDESLRSLIDEMEIRDYPKIEGNMPYMFISDLRRVGFHEVDFGWGKSVYGGPGYAWPSKAPDVDFIYQICRDEEGEEVTMVAMCLPALTMEFFVEELSQLINIRGVDPFATPMFIY